MKRELPVRYAVYEKEPRVCSKPDSVILAPYDTIAEAEEDSVKYGYTGDNYYIGPEK